MKIRLKPIKGLPVRTRFHDVRAGIIQAYCVRSLSIRNIPLTNYVLGPLLRAGRDEPLYLTTIRRLFIFVWEEPWHAD